MIRAQREYDTVGIDIDALSAALVPFLIALIALAISTFVLCYVSVSVRGGKYVACIHTFLKNKISLK